MKQFSRVAGNTARDFQREGVEAGDQLKTTKGPEQDGDCQDGRNPQDQADGDRIMMIS
jgi:hypothetical protein